MRKKRMRWMSAIAVTLVFVLAFQLVGCSLRKKQPTSSESDITNNSSSTPSGEGVVEPPIDEIVSIVVNLAQKQPIVGEELERDRVIGAENLNSYGVSVSTTSRDGLMAYSSDDIEVSYDTNADEYGVFDTVTVNDTILLEQGYYTSEDDENLALSEIYADYYEVEVDYNDNGQVEGLYYYDTYYIYHYDSNGCITSINRNGDDYKTFYYNANGNIVKEESVSNEISFIKQYAYTEEGELHSVNGEKVAGAKVSEGSVSLGDSAFTYENNTVSIECGEKSASFIYDYSFNNEKFLTEKVVDGTITNYKYVGDKIVELSKEDEALSYILDKDLNYVGLSYNDTKYYFAVDPYGNVMGLIDNEGYFAVEYHYDAWGSLIGITGDLSETLGKFNEIINLNGIYDHTLNCYFFAESIYSPINGISINGTKVSHVRDIYQWEQSNYFARSAVSSFARIHDMVVEVAVKNLKEQGVDVASNLYATDSNGDSRRLVDIYTLPYEITPFSTKNLLQGNQIYEVIYHAPDSEKFLEIATSKLQEITDNWMVSYFADYSPEAGRMSFHGQFIFLEYLIDYRCNQNGIVEYQVKNNVKQNYDQTINIYDYDNDKYVCFVNNTFDLNFLDGVTIIPGINQEQYEALDGYLTDYLQSVAGNVCDQMLIYDDPNYYDLENMNVMPDYWAQMNLEDTTTYLEIQNDGTISVEKMPVWETDAFATKLFIGAGVILVTAIVATVAIMVPGANCVVVSICVGAAKGAVAGALSGFAMGFVEPLIGIAIEGVATGNWDFSNYFNDALSAAIDGFASGAITGAIMGGISGGLNPKYCFEAGTAIATASGSTNIENIAVGDMVWSYDYKTGEKSLKPVTATTVRETNQVISVEIGGEQIVTTPEHPFYVVNNDKYNGYVAAKYLSVGDCVQTADGGYLEITAIEQQTLDEPITVYNFTVDDNHSYYVGDNELLVHNANCTYDASTSKQFRSEKQLYSHYGNHVNARGEFGNITMAEYLSKAQNLANSPQHLVTTLRNGEKVFYNQATNEFLKLSSDGFIKTFFRPDDGINYLKALRYIL